MQLRSVAQRIRVDGLQRRRRVVISCAPGSSEQLQQDDAVQFLHGALVALNEGPRCRRVFASGGLSRERCSRIVAMRCALCLPGHVCASGFAQRIAARPNSTTALGEARPGKALFSWCEYGSLLAGPLSLGANSVYPLAIVLAQTAYHTASACGVCLRLHAACVRTRTISESSGPLSANKHPSPVRARTPAATGSISIVRHSTHIRHGSPDGCLLVCHWRFVGAVGA